MALASDRKQPDPVREQAMAGLADGAHHSSNWLRCPKRLMRRASLVCESRQPVRF